jgi:formyl-CoA transferase
MSRVLAGPFCTMYLGDLGADVIKIEHPGTGDDTRSWGPPFVQGESAYYLAINRNKRSAAIDLKCEGGRKIIRDLAARSDVLVENFRPGTMERLGLGYRDLEPLNPRLVYCAVSGFGRTGPDRDRSGLDVILAAAGGLMSITGEEGRSPVKPGVALTDLATGLGAMAAIVSALYARQSTGKGQRVDLSLLGMQVALLVNAASNYLLAGVVQRPWGSAHPSIVPYQAFEAADGYLVIGATNDMLWQKFCAAAGLAHLADDARFAANSGRVAHRREILEAIVPVIQRLPREEWVERFRRAGVPCAPVNTIDEVFRDPQVVHLGLVGDVPHPSLGALPLVGNPMVFSRTPAGTRRHPPLLGEHTYEVLHELLGYDAASIEQLHTEGSVRLGPSGGP